MKLSDEPRIFVYDNYPGGIGFSQPLFEMNGELLARTRNLIAGCECQHGCPTCVGPVGNTGPMAKLVALRILDLILEASSTATIPTVTRLEPAAQRNSVHSIADSRSARRRGATLLSKHLFQRGDRHRAAFAAVEHRSGFS